MKAVMEKWSFPQLWTLTVNPKAYPDQRRILEWIKAERCVSTLVRSCHRKGWLNSANWYAVMEFQDGSRNVDGVGTEQVHFHLLLDVKPPLPWQDMWALWESKAPPWRASGELMNKHDPAMGFVRFDKVYKSEGLAGYLAKGVAGYLSKGPKNLPSWFVQYLDDGHNMQLKYYSRGFFASLPKPEKKYTRPASNPNRKRRKVSERVAQCRHDADGYLMIDNKPVFIDRAAFDWETTLQVLEESMSEENLEACRRLGRVKVTGDEFIRVCGYDAWCALRDKNDGQGVGISATAAALDANGVVEVNPSESARERFAGTYTKTTRGPKKARGKS